MAAGGRDVTGAHALGRRVEQPAAMARNGVVGTAIGDVTGHGVRAELAERKIGAARRLCATGGVVNPARRRIVADVVIGSTHERGLLVERVPRGVERDDGGDARESTKPVDAEHDGVLKFLGGGAGDAVGDAAVPARIDAIGDGVNGVVEIAGGASAGGIERERGGGRGDRLDLETEGRLRGGPGEDLIELDVGRLPGRWLESGLKSNRREEKKRGEKAGFHAQGMGKFSGGGEVLMILLWRTGGKIYFTQ